MKRLVFVAFSLLALCSPALAWSGAAHMVIAGIAYSELPAATKAKVEEIYKRSQ